MRKEELPTSGFRMPRDELGGTAQHIQAIDEIKETEVPARQLPVAIFEDPEKPPRCVESRRLEDEHRRGRKHPGTEDKDRDGNGNRG